MALKTSAIESVVAAHRGRTFPAASIVVRQGGAETYARAFGELDPDARQHPTQLDTRFDLASVSKLFTVTAFMALVEAGRLALDQPVREVLRDFDGWRAIAPYPHPLQTGELVAVVPPTDAQADAGRVTFRHLLAHNSGLPAWLPLWSMSSRAEMREAALRAPFAYPTGAHTVYSDIGLILLGFALEATEGQSLGQIVRARVCAPLGLDSVDYGPLGCANVAPTEYDARLGQRLCGEVHDENARALGGAGHAGVFANARDVAALGAMYLGGGAPLLEPATVAEMTRLQAHDGDVRRGLGFALWSPDPESSGNPFSERAFGHTGFTGTSLWIDPARELVVVCLANRVYFGRDNADATQQFRIALHRAVVNE